MPETQPDDQREDQEPQVTDDGPAPEELDQDPAYEPQDEEAKRLKGG